jgi:hypothetical protein
MNRINIIIKILITLMLLASIVGAAAEEGLKATWTGTQIKSEAWNFLIPQGSGTQWYQIRYYPPGTFPTCSPTPCTVNYENGLFITPNVKFEGKEIYIESKPYEEYYTPPPNAAGDWTVALFKDGTYSPTKPGDVPKSFKVSVPIIVPIPEFSTIALPIAAVIGLVFFFQHKKKKEE